MYSIVKEIGAFCLCSPAEGRRLLVGRSANSATTKPTHSFLFHDHISETGQILISSIVCKAGVCPYLLSLSLISFHEATAIFDYKWPA